VVKIVAISSILPQILLHRHCILWVWQW